ncbi:MAG: hypothetical protein OEL87_02985 [Nanoarchaeota archaeon]|nr:hypothetical protein [Nanoarchaeota archaeon]
MVINKRAQFFLLAAVIISVVVISLGIVTNRAIVSNEPKSFYDFSYSVDKETSAVMDYEIYSGFDEGDNLTEFVDLLAEDIRDKTPGANFLFIYGSNEGMNLSNYGTEDAYVGEENVPGSGSSVISSICLGGNCKKVEDIVEDFDDEIGHGYFNKESMAEKEDISVEVKGSKFTFPISRHKQVIFIIQKDVDDESFVASE